MKSMLLTLALFVGVSALAADCKVACMMYEYPDGEKAYTWADMSPLGACPHSHTCKQPSYQTDHDDSCQAEQEGQKITGVCVSWTASED